MIMEPMAGATAENREREERQKFRDGIKGGRGSGSMKRKRDDDKENGKSEAANEAGVVKKPKKSNGPKGPNPLSVKKSKRKSDGVKYRPAAKEEKKEPEFEPDSREAMDGSEPSAKRKRKRKHRSGGASEELGKSKEAEVTGEGN
jgi:U3 small nucleolar RNA-associated protein 23